MFEFEILTTGDLMRLMLLATAQICRKVEAEPALNKVEDILRDASDGWQVIDRLYRIQHHIPMDA
jgi:hypothetical protein